MKRMPIPEKPRRVIGRLLARELSGEEFAIRELSAQEAARVGGAQLAILDCKGAYSCYDTGGSADSDRDV